MELKHIDIGDLIVSAHNMRGKGKADIDAILPSVRARGILVPLIVRPVANVTMGAGAAKGDDAQEGACSAYGKAPAVRTDPAEIGAALANDLAASETAAIVSAASGKGAAPDNGKAEKARGDAEGTGQQAEATGQEGKPASATKHRSCSQKQLVCFRPVAAASRFVDVARPTGDAGE